MWRCMSIRCIMTRKPFCTVQKSYSDAGQGFATESDAALSDDIRENTDLTDDAAWAAVAYRRVRSVKNYALLAGESIPGTLNDDPPPEQMTFTGRVTHGTGGLQCATRFNHQPALWQS